MSGVSWEEELEAHQIREDEMQDADGADSDVQTSPVSGTRDPLANPMNHTDVEFDIDDRDSLRGHMSDLVGELTGETPTQRDIHNLTLLFSSPRTAEPAQILQRLADFMKLASEALQAELSQVLDRQPVRTESPGVGPAHGPRDPRPQASPAPASPPPFNRPSKSGLHTVFSTVTRI